MKSPVPEKKQKKELDFTEAMQEVLTGKSITKLEWGSKKYHALLKDEYLTLHKPDGKYYNWLISEGDMRGDDYVVL